MKKIVRMIGCLVAGCLLWSVGVEAAVMENYCITPPFITAGIKPNLLLLIDNSASMYDLAYVDKGLKHCSGSSNSCFYDSECPTGQTCSVFDRSPYYCFDQTYKGANNYYGYFDKDKYYTYRSGTDDFAEVASAFPSGCGSVAVGSTIKTIPSTMCLEYLGSAVKSFVAKGNYLNWLTASKFDIQKKILTGGLYDGSGMIPESRGCVGRGYIKQANSTDYVNFSGGPANDTNQPLGVTFTVTGPANTSSATAPSTGGQTYINLYAGSTYNYADCQAAVDAIASGGNADIKKTVDACLNSSELVSGYCQQKTIQSCDTSAQCLLDNAKASTVKVCSAGTGTTCTTDAGCNIAARSSCQLDSSMVCSGATDTTSCKVNTAAVTGTCTSWSPALASGGQPPSNCDLAGNASTTVYDRTGDGKYECKYKKSNETNYHYAACSYTPATTTEKGPCVSTAAQNLGSCISNYTGPCVLPAAAVATKSKVAFQQSLQACWALRAHGTAINGDDINTVLNQCPDIYGSLATCSHNHQLTCSPAVANSCGAGNTCQTGPYAITPGSHALLCGSDYEGQFYELSGGAWVLKAGYSKSSQEMLDVHTAFCNEMTRPNVTDPTDAPSNTVGTDNIPAILSGIGVEAQLGAPKATMRAKVVIATPACTVSDCATGTSCVGSVCKPTGLVQQFSSQIRLGAMSFNPFGSASETALTGTPKTCKTGSSNAGNVCTQDPDCDAPPVSGNCTSTGTVNLDGARILYPIGYGVCSTMTNTPCTLDAECAPSACLNGYCGVRGTTPCTTTLGQCSGANLACIANSAGDHTASGSLIKSLDDIRAGSWTPFSEAYFTAIGYFAQIPTGTDKGKSRTALRLNALNTTNTDFSGGSAPPIDFNENLNPSEMRCQQNYTMLISDGSSTADRNTTVNTMATLYAGPAGITQTTCTGAPSGTTTDYGGTNNLPIMSWVAKNRNIAAVNKSGSASTDVPAQARDSITSYVVFNGESNGASGDCNSLTLLSKTAVNGGTTIKQANNYPELVTALTSVFQDVAAKAASGTAASILSNSEGSGANILQAVFYPKKIFESNTPVSWIGEMQNLWYYVDPYVKDSTIREDTDGPDVNGAYKLNIITDLVTRFDFDNSADKTLVQLSRDSNGDGSGDTLVGGLIDPDNVKSIWRAGKQLWSRDLAAVPRTIYTPFISGGTEVTGTGLMKFTYSSPDDSTVLQPYLQYPADNAAAKKLMKWVHGFDFPGDTSIRNRTVKIGNLPASAVSTVSTDQYVTNPRDKGIGVWKLGDIISSTPRVQSTVRLGTYNLPAPGGYSDSTYQEYISSSNYGSRGMVYVGANDGMLHAFKLGVLSVKATGNDKATLTGDDLGKEEWAFIPKNYLPYLKYIAQPDYQHLYAIDGRTMLLDASIGDASVTGNYWAEAKTSSSWRTIVIGGMGLGGASRRSCSGDTACVQTPINDPADATRSLGYSSYFALDVTDQNNPKLLWEFNDNQLGFSTTGASIVRVGDRNKNGRWFAVFGNGPFGPIDQTTRQFKGNSDHHLRFFIVDLKTGALVKTITTDVDNGFAGSMLGGAIDADRRAGTTVSANYQDDAIYVGYTKQVSGSWTAGGVGRLMVPPLCVAAADNTCIAGEPDDTYVNNVGTFNWSKVIDDIGPVTTSISRLQDTRVISKNLWLFFGSGRYFYRDGTGLDDYSSRRRLYGVKEPCYNNSTATPAMPGNFINHNCTTTLSALNSTCPTVYNPLVATLANQTGTVSTLAANAPGWCIDLNASTDTLGAERVVTDTVALTNGSVLFTTFKPTMDKCGYGGNSFLRPVFYESGGTPSCNSLRGKVLVQLSTGEFKEVSLAEEMGCLPNGDGGWLLPYPTPPGPNPPTPGPGPPPEPPGPWYIGGGKPPSDAPPVVSSSQNKPVKKILHIQEH